jgi:hypothetical protein
MFFGSVSQTESGGIEKHQRKKQTDLLVCRRRLVFGRGGSHIDTVGFVQTLGIRHFDSLRAFNSGARPA